MKTRRHLSLRARLLHLLAWPLLLVLLLSAVYDYVGALDRARDNQDFALSRIAIALASRLDLDADDARDDDLALHLTRTMAAMQRADGRDRLAYLVLGQDAMAIGGDMALAGFAKRDGPTGTAQQPSYADWQSGAEHLRVVTYPHQSPLGPLTVVVAETTERREAQARQVLIDTLMPNLLLLGLALGLVYVGVHVAMRPLVRLSSQVAARRLDDFSAMRTAHLPGEVVPLALAINGLMDRMRTSALAQQTFLSNAAHQLRTPLAGMQTQLELASKDADPVQRARLDSLQAALQRMGRSTHQMLALARAGPQALPAESFQTVDLRELLEDAASIWLDTALASQVDLGFELRAAPVTGSAWMLNEMIGNLVHNALRHSPRGGRVTVRCGLDAGHCVLAVEDEGPGIAEAERERVFERFYQAPGAARGGCGLGLAIVREVALRHAAELDLGPASGGRGLLVRLRFVSA